MFGNVPRAGVVGELASRGIEQRLSRDRDDEDAQESRHILGWGRSLAWLEDVVEEQKVHGEETDDQKNLDSASHASIVAVSCRRPSTLPYASVLSPYTYSRASVSSAPVDHPAPGPRNWLTSSAESATTASVSGRSSSSRPSHLNAAVSNLSSSASA